uniref:J domain-containing protein n=1 Tax=Physcomitrium patens TaxID=3218 RepID=A0A7I4CB40_PHYPA
MAMAVAMARAAVVSCRAAHTQLYEVLKVERMASPAQLKSAYRNLAKNHHPDVSSHPDAQARFIELSNAYEILIDPEMRKIYDETGEQGLKGRESNRRGAAQEVWETWAEFKPFKRKTRKGDARSSAAARSGSTYTPENGESVCGTEAQNGDVVEYPLSDAIKAQHQDDRLKGVGLVVSRNIDRGDRDKLSVENLTLVEIEPLYREPNSSVWRADPMEGAAFASLPDLRILRTVRFTLFLSLFSMLDFSLIFRSSPY